MNGTPWSPWIDEDWVDRVNAHAKATGNPAESFREITAVRCERCRRRHGGGTRMGDMMILPASLGGTWAWSSVRRESHGYLPRATRRVDDLVRGGGVEAHCRRCGARPRLKLARLIEMAQEARSHGINAVYV